MKNLSKHFKTAVSDEPLGFGCKPLVQLTFSSETFPGHFAGTPLAADPSKDHAAVLHSALYIMYTYFHVWFVFGIMCNVSYISIFCIIIVAVHFILYFPLDKYMVLKSKGLFSLEKQQKQWTFEIGRAHV